MYSLPSMINNSFYPLFPDYDQLTDEGKGRNMSALLNGWFDENNATTVISDVEVFLLAFEF